MASFPGAKWLATGKHGYGSTTTHKPVRIIDHSAEGYRAAMLSIIENDELEKSWHFSVMRNSEVWQHMSIARIAWHAGSFDANNGSIGIEHEGVTGEPLTPPQYQATLKLHKWLFDTLKLGKPSRSTNLREHNEYTSTSCPSGRIPWAQLIEDLEEDVTPEEVKAMIHSETPNVKFKPTGHGGATLKQWVSSYDNHRKGYGGRRCTHKEYPIFIRKTGTASVYMAVGNVLFHVPSSGTLKQLYGLYGGGRVKSYDVTNPIWKLPKFTLS